MNIDFCFGELSYVCKIYNVTLMYAYKVGVKNFFFEGYELDDECKAFLASDDIIPVVIDTFAREIEAIEDFSLKSLQNRKHHLDLQQ